MATKQPVSDAVPTNQNTPGSAASAGGGALVPLPTGGGSSALALPPELAAQLAQEARDEAAAERPSLSKFSLRGGMIGYQGNPVKNNVLTVVVLAAIHRNAYYDRPFDPNNLSNPACFALSEDGEDMEAHENVPDENVPKSSELNGHLRSENGRSCAGCKFNDWGSSPKQGSRGKACSETRRLVLLPVDALTSADAVMKAELGIMDLPVTSCANYSNMVNGLAASANVPVYAATVDISTVRDMKTQFKVTFEPKSLIGDMEVLAAVKRRREEAVRYALTPYDEVASTQSSKMAPGDGTAKKADKF